MYLELKEFYGLWKVNENIFFIYQVNVFLLMIMNGKMKNQIKLFLIGKDLDHQTIKNQLDFVDLILNKKHNKVLFDF